MLISNDHNIKSSSVYLASVILKLFRQKKTNKLSIFEINNELKKKEINTYRQLFSALAFLYSTSIIDFEEPYIFLVHD